MLFKFKILLQFALFISMVGKNTKKKNVWKRVVMYLKWSCINGDNDKTKSTFLQQKVCEIAKLGYARLLSLGVQ